MSILAYYCFVLFFRRIQVPKKQIESIYQSNQERPKVFIVRRNSYITKLFFKYLCKSFKNLPTFIEGLSKPETLETVLKHNGAILLFVKNSPNFKKNLQTALSFQEATFYCVLLLWFRKVRNKENKSFLDYPRGVLKFILLLINSKNSRLYITKSFSTTEISQSENSERLLLNCIEEERTSIIGPHQYSKNQVIENILRDDTFLEQFKDQHPKHVQKKVTKYLKEIATDRRIHYIDKAVSILDYVWSKTSEGVYVDKERIEKIRELAKKHQIIYVPCHRSHADYLLIGQYLVKNDLDSPITAAGVNLSFFPLGFFFRRFGAYFIRRSFKGNPIYASTFTRYLEELLIQGASQKFYIEGGRSRTGKILPPKLGMLSMILKVLQHGKVKNVYFVPISVDYGKLFEGESYIDELRGKTKQKESVKGLLDTFKYLKRKQGINYIQFGEPFSSEDFFAEKEVTLQSLSENQFNDVTSQLGYRIIHKINEAVTVTPSAVVSTVLLANPKRGIKKEELLRITRFLHNYLHNKNVRIPSEFSDIEKAVEKVIWYFTESNYIQSLTTSEATIYRVNENSRLFLDYYKNNIIHLFLPSAFLSAILLLKKQCTFTHLNDGVKRLKALFQKEFIYNHAVWSEESVHELLRYFSILKEVQHEGDIITLNPHKHIWLQLCHRIILNYFEGYYVVCEFLLKHQEKNNEKEFINKALEYGYSVYEVGAIYTEESVSRDLYKNAVAFLKAEKILGASKEHIEVIDRKGLVGFKDEFLEFIQLI